MPDMVRMHGIVLIGARGSGKTTIGMALAQTLAWTFTDADQVLENRCKSPIRDLFARDGEAAFRDREEAILGDLLAVPGPWVLATGGGVVVREANRRALRRWGGPVAYLCAPAAVLSQRLARDEGGRPSLTGKPVQDEVDEVLAIRDPLYRQCAQAVIDVDRPVAQVVDDLIALLPP